jgi:hypothetical protein
VASKMLVVLKH